MSVFEVLGTQLSKECTRMYSKSLCRINCTVQEFSIFNSLQYCECTRVGTL